LEVKDLCLTHLGIFPAQIRVQPKTTYNMCGVTWSKNTIFLTNKSLSSKIRLSKFLVSVTKSINNHMMAGYVLSTEEAGILSFIPPFLLCHPTSKTAPDTCTQKLYTASMHLS
jgi:hypothetical protein